MKKGSLTYTGIVTLIIGIVLIFLRATAIDVVVITVGIGFLLTAVVNVIMIMSRKNDVEVNVNGKKESHAAISVGAVITAMGAAALGLWMVLAPGSFSSVIVYVFSALIIIAGLYHITLLAYGLGGARFPFVFYILPILLVLTGVVLLIIGVDTIKASIVLITGIALVVYSVCNFIEAAGEGNYKKLP